MSNGICPPAAGGDHTRLSSPLRESGYRHVYRHRRAWVAKVKLDRRLVRIGAAPPPRDAARLVARWFEERYGGAWPSVEANRHRRPWRIRWSARLGLYMLDVWELGVPVPQAPRGRPGFRSRAGAEAFSRKYVRRKYGLFAPVSLWRA